MFSKKSKKQKEYMSLLKDDITKSIESFKKRYQLFPWNKVNKLKKLDMNSTLTVDGSTFTIRELVKEIDKIKAKLQSRLKPSYYNFILKAYIKDSYNKTDKELSSVYSQYKSTIDESFKESKSDLIFCLNGLKEINKKFKNDEVFKEHVDDIIEDINSYEVLSESSIPHKSIDTIIFDFGSVLIKNTSGINGYKMYHDKWKNESMTESELRKMFSSYYDNIRKHETADIVTSRRVYTLSLPKNLQKYAHDVYSVAASSKEVYDYTVPLLKYLKSRGYKLYYLSNWGRASFELCQQKGIFDIIKYFDGGIVSYKVGFQKPGEEIYKLLLDKYKINPEKALFFDDMKENVNAANKLKINGVIFNQDTVEAIMKLPKANTVITEACKDLATARKFVAEVGKLARKYDANYFIVTDGASGTSNKDNPAVKNARKCQIKWEKKHGFDPNEDWSKDKEVTESIDTVQHHTFQLSHSQLPCLFDNTEVDIDGFPDEKLPIPLTYFPNHMGINLCSVDSISWDELPDGQLLNITIRFDPDLSKERFEESVHSIDDFLCEATGNQSKTDFFNKFKSYVNSKGKFNNSVRPLSHPMTHKSKKGEEWLLLATIDTHNGFDKIAKELKSKVKYNEEEITYHTCYLPGDMFCFIKLPNKKIVKEREELSMRTTFVNDKHEIVDMNDFLLECALGVLDDVDDTDMVATEGANLDIRAIYKAFKKEYRGKMKKFKSLVKENKFSDAINELESIKKDIEKAKKDVLSIDAGNYGSVAFGFVSAGTVTFLRTFVLSLALPIFGSLVANIHNIIDELAHPVSKAISGHGKELTADDINLYKNTVNSQFKTMTENIDRTIKKTKELQKNYEKEQKEEAKKEKAVKESAEFRDAKLALYEACSNGEITIEEREELFKDLQDKFYIKEHASDITEDKGLSNQEKFDQVRKILYERCSAGEITIHERESLIGKAYDAIFVKESEEEEGSASQVAADKGIDQKEVEKKVGEAIKTNGADMSKALDKEAK